MEKKGAQDESSITKIAADQTAFDVEASNVSGKECIVKTTHLETLRIAFSLSTMALAAPYACSFGGELAIENILSTYYAKVFPYLGQTGAGNWAAMFGLLNVVCRPAGGLISDILYRSTGSTWSKKMWLVSLGIIMGAFELAVGLSNPTSQASMFGLMAGLAFFLEAANGANFSLVPHAYPSANGSSIFSFFFHFLFYLILYANGVFFFFFSGIVSGTVGAMGNFGGIIFSIIFRYNNGQYGQSIWIIGVISIAINLAFCWIRPSHV